MPPRSHAHFLSPERKSRRQNEGRQRSSTSRSAGPRGRFQGLAVARETSNVCVHPEKERERMKCLLSDIEGLSAEIENLRTFSPDNLYQALRNLFRRDPARSD